MAEEKMISEKEAVMRERAAFLAGSCEWVDEARQAVAVRYPLPKVTRPRVVRSPDNPLYELRCVGDHIEERFAPNGTEWKQASGWTPNRRMIEAFADLLANPTEEVEDV